MPTSWTGNAFELSSSSRGNVATLAIGIVPNITITTVALPAGRVGQGYEATIQAQGGRSGPEWLSSHPNPGNRSEAITREAAMLRVEGNANTGQFASIQSRLRGMSPAYTAEQIARGQARRRSVGTAGRSSALPAVP